MTFANHTVWELFKFTDIEKWKMLHLLCLESQRSNWPLTGKILATWLKEKKNLESYFLRALMVGQTMQNTEV